MAQTEEHGHLPTSEEAGTQRGHRRYHATQRMEPGRAEICFFFFPFLVISLEAQEHGAYPQAPDSRRKALCLLAAEVLGNRMFQLMESYCLTVDGLEPHKI